MLKSEKISAQFELILNHLESADYEMQKLPVELVNSEVIYSLHNRIQDIISDVEGLHYETVGPMQVEEDERDEEIRVLERRLAELRAQ